MWQILHCKAFLTGPSLLLLANHQMRHSSAWTTWVNREVPLSFHEMAKFSRPLLHDSNPKYKIPQDIKSRHFMINDQNSDNGHESDGFELKTTQVQLSNGIIAETITAIPKESKDYNDKPTLVFIHGSFHAAWCWAENYMPYFASHNYISTALSLRGTGGTFAGENVKKVKIMEHVQDLTAFLEYVDDTIDRPRQKTNKIKPKPVLITHSFGGLAVMKYLETMTMHNNYQKLSDLLSGVALFCSVPPSGNGKMTLRYLGRSIRDSWKITAGFAMKKCINDADLCRTLFFSTNDDPTGGISDEDIWRYQSYFDRDTVATIDLGDLARKLPSASSKTNGEAPFLGKEPNIYLPALVVGASDDFIVDKEGVTETATYFGVQSPVVVDSPHDIMLGPKWKNGAKVLLNWIHSNT